MNPQSTRRRFLQAGVALAPPLVAGCSQFRDDDDSDSDVTTDPDEGTDSYGIELDSRIDVPATIQIETTKPFEDEPIWEKEVTLESGSIQTYHSILTAEHGEQAFTAKLRDIGGDEELEKTRSDGFWITPGSEDAPDVTHFKIHVRHATYEDNSFYDIDAVSRDPRF